MSEANLRYKLNKKLKLSIGGSKNSKVGSKRAQSSADDKSEKGWNRNFKSNVKDEQSYEGRGGSKVYGKEKFKPLNYGGKRKRIYTDPDAGREETSHYLEKSRRKVSFKESRNQVNYDVIKEKSRNHSPRTMWVSSRIEDANSKTKRSSRKPKDAVESVQVSDGKLKTKLKEFDKREPVKMDGSQNDSLKKRVKSKSDSNKHLDQSRSRTPDVYKLRSVKKTVRVKKNLDGDSEIMDDQPIKKKRVIRIDPHDISNKRLDDGIVISESTKEKEKDVEKKVEMSKNAQFRAIQPSPSMLSYVEDNLLGRRRLIELRRAGYNIELSAPLDNIPFSTSSERERIEENIFRNKLEFFAAAKISSSFPPPDLPEIAFAGRSNVGKSSLLNALTRQWGVARTSDKPGLTQTINFFKLGPKHCLVDLPGYGFAYAKEEVKDAWEELVKEYVSTRVGLKRVCLLIDSKWGMKPRDRELIDLMERSETKYQIVLTKTDAIFPIDVARRATQIEESLKANKSVVQPVLMASSKTGAGIRSLRTVLAKIARFAKL